MCVSAYGPEDDDGRGGNSQHQHTNHDAASGGHTKNHLGANGHGQRGFADGHNTNHQHAHTDGSPCHHSADGHEHHDGYSTSKCNL